MDAGQLRRGRVDGRRQQRRERVKEAGKVMKPEKRKIRVDGCRVERTQGRGLGKEGIEGGEVSAPACKHKRSLMTD